MFLSWLFSRSRPWPPPLSSRKISETLLDFASPITSHLPLDVGPKRLEVHLRFAMAVWNAVVADAWGTHGDDNLAELRASLAGFDASLKPHALAWIHLLTKRKRKRRFRDDLRAVGALSVRAVPTSDLLRIRAEARLPDELRRLYGFPDPPPESAPRSGRTRRHRRSR